MRRSDDEQEAVGDSEVNNLLGGRTEAGFERDHLRPSVCHVHLRFRAKNMYCGCMRVWREKVNWIRKGKLGFF